LTVWLFAASAASAEIETTAETERLLAAAAHAEIAGDEAGRNSLLQRAVQSGSPSRLARWQLGQLEIQGKWLAADQIAEKAAADPRQLEYAALRDSYGDTPEGQLALARWCEKKGLADEARFHWTSVLSIQPNHEEALRELDAQWYDGQLLTREQIALAKVAERELEKSQRGWKSRLVAWNRGLEGDLSLRMAALAEVSAIDSPAAIPVVEQATLDQTTSAELADLRRRHLGRAFLDALDRMSGPRAAESLVRHAVLSPFETIRTSAVDRLKQRQMYEYVPYLLDNLSAPVFSWFGVITQPDGSVHYRHRLYREGPFADWSFEANRSALRQPTALEARTRLDGEAGITADQWMQMDRALWRGIARNVRRFNNQFGRQAFDTERQVAEFNGSVGEMNERIFPVLSQTTGQDFGDSPRAWWDWWQDYNGYEYSDDRPIYNFAYQDQQQYSVPTVPLGGVGGGAECFVRGTPVWTKTGPRPIETLRMGDLVLSQNVDTGELAFKAIVGTTIRPPSPMVQLTIGKEQITATVGHPFWVAGTGWRMAKELVDGAVLHGVKSPARIAAAAPAEQAESYNLVVAEFATYFVGEQGILVHDNTPRSPTAAIVPGVTAP
jgi:hypothetical protein